MEYEGRICRAPMERASYMLPVAVGCSYNACKFCMLFKHLTHRELPLEQVEAEILRVKAAGGDPKTVFLGDGNAFGMDTPRLMKILDMIHEHFPSCRNINMDATVTNIAAKSDEELKALSDAGVNRLYLGIESGLDDVLKQMAKDHTLSEAYEQIARIQAVGMTYAAHIMTGIAGKGRGIENAEAMAEFINKTKPVAICNFSLFAHKRSPLWKEVEAGRFEVASEQENILEERRMLELFETEGMDYDGMHDWLEFRVRGHLPRDKEKMLKKIDSAMEEYGALDPVYCIVE